MDAGHSDYIHDVCYDYYGTRLATCGSDRKINVFEKDENEEWNRLWTVEVRTDVPPVDGRTLTDWDVVYCCVIGFIAAST